MALALMSQPPAPSLCTSLWTMVTERRPWSIAYLSEARIRRSEPSFEIGLIPMPLSSRMSQPKVSCR